MVTTAPPESALDVATPSEDIVTLGLKDANEEKATATSTPGATIPLRHVSSTGKGSVQESLDDTAPESDRRSEASSAHSSSSKGGQTPTPTPTPTQRRESTSTPTSIEFHATDTDSGYNGDLDGAVDGALDESVGEGEQESATANVKAMVAAWEKKPSFDSKEDAHSQALAKKAANCVAEDVAAKKVTSAHQEKQEGADKDTTTKTNGPQVAVPDVLAEKEVTSESSQRLPIELGSSDPHVVGEETVLNESVKAGESEADQKSIEIAPMTEDVASKEIIHQADPSREETVVEQEEVKFATSSSAVEESPVTNSRRIGTIMTAVEVTLNDQVSAVIADESEDSEDVDGAEEENKDGHNEDIDSNPVEIQGNEPCAGDKVEETAEKQTAGESALSGEITEKNAVDDASEIETTKEAAVSTAPTVGVSPLCDSAHVVTAVTEMWSKVNHMVHKTVNDVCFETSVERTLSMDCVARDDGDQPLATAKASIHGDAIHDLLIAPPPLKKRVGRPMTFESVNSETGSIRMLLDEDVNEAEFQSDGLEQVSTEKSANVDHNNSGNESNEQAKEAPQDALASKDTVDGTTGKVPSIRRLPFVQKPQVTKKEDGSVASLKSTTSAKSRSSRRSVSSRKSSSSQKLVQTTLPPKATNVNIEEAEPQAASSVMEDVVPFEPVGNFAEDISVEVGSRKLSTRPQETNPEPDSAEDNETSFLQLKFGLVPAQEIQVVSKSNVPGSVDCDVSVFSEFSVEISIAKGSATSKNDSMIVLGDEVEDEPRPDETNENISSTKKGRKPLRAAAKGLKNFFAMKRGGKPPLPKPKEQPKKSENTTAIGFLAADAPEDPILVQEAKFFDGIHGDLEQIQAIPSVEEKKDDQDSKERPELGDDTVLLDSTPNVSELIVIPLESPKVPEPVVVPSEAPKADQAAVTTVKSDLGPRKVTNEKKMKAKSHFSRLFNRKSQKDLKENSEVKKIKADKSRGRDVRSNTPRRSRSLEQKRIVPSAIQGISGDSSPRWMRKRSVSKSRDSTSVQNRSKAESEGGFLSVTVLSDLIKTDSPKADPLEAESTKANSPEADLTTADSPRTDSSLMQPKDFVIASAGPANDSIESSIAGECSPPESESPQRVKSAPSSLNKSNCSIEDQSIRCEETDAKENIESSAEKKVERKKTKAKNHSGEMRSDDSAESRPENDFQQLVKSFSSDASAAARQIIEELQYSLQSESAEVKLKQVKPRGYTGEDTCNAKCSGELGDLEVFPKIAALVGGLAQDVARETSLFEMFTQGLLCCSGPVEEP